MKRSARERVPCRLRATHHTVRENTMSEPQRAIDTALFDPGHRRVRRLLPARERRLARRQPRPARVRRLGRAADRPRAQPGRAAPAARGRGGPDGAARVRRPDGGRLLRGGDGRGGDRRRRRGAARRRTWRASTPPRPSPTSATSCATCSAAARPRSTRSASRPTSRTRTPTSSTSARAGWGCPSATTTRATTSSRWRCATQYVAHVARQLGNLGDAEERAQEAAERILAFETRLAEASYTAEQLRDVQLTMNRLRRRRAGRAHAGLRPERLRGGPRRHVGDGQRGQPRLLRGAGRDPRRHSRSRR